MSYAHRIVNTHPQAYEDQKLMINTLKESSNWIEGTYIKHDWDKSNNSVLFIYDFPNTDDDVIDQDWENEIIDAIKQHRR